MQQANISTHPWQFHLFDGNRLNSINSSAAFWQKGGHTSSVRGDSLHAAISGTRNGCGTSLALFFGKNAVRLFSRANSDYACEGWLKCLERRRNRQSKRRYQGVPNQSSVTGHRPSKVQPKPGVRDPPRLRNETRSPKQHRPTSLARKRRKAGADAKAFAPARSFIWARPLGITTIIGTALPSLIRLSNSLSGAANRCHSVSSPPIPCNK
jgi:hypothetical protein